VVVFTGGGGAPTIGGGWLELLQHRTQRGGEEGREIWVENPGRWSSSRGRGGCNGGTVSSEVRPWRGHWRGLEDEGDGWDGLCCSSREEQRRG
jgi:hypothetical protein